MDTNGITTLSKETNDGPRFITIAEFMKRTTLSRATVFRHIRAGLIPAFKAGRRVIIDADFLTEMQAMGRLAQLNKEADK